ncbi:hypothetical protein [Rhodococcus sp. NPDC058514]|uniref:hypothetical protein n=1 Tax=unclassified Rhodococcus (in: high G+C Gram-positive bacteria) TaxID=192944 RepID=UPI00365E8FF3
MRRRKYRIGRISPIVPGGIKLEQDADGVVSISVDPNFDPEVVAELLSNAVEWACDEMQIVANSRDW